MRGFSCATEDAGFFDQFGWSDLDYKFDIGLCHGLDKIDTNAISIQMEYCGVYRTDA